MSVCAVMMVKDEADVIAHTIEHLLTQVDKIIVSDNMSTDGTVEILEKYDVELQHDEEIGYFQSAKTTKLASQVSEQGFDWVLPCDADEVWYAPDGRPLRDWLDGVGREVQIVTAELFNHLVTAEDTAALSPFRRMGWRQRERAPLSKVCCRARPDLVIAQGNHDASTAGTAMRSTGLVVRHFPYRSAEQFVTKAVNGGAAYAATDLPLSAGSHWRGYGQMVEEHGVDAAKDWFYEWFFSKDPRSDSSLIYDPAPVVDPLEAMYV